MEEKENLNNQSSNSEEAVNNAENKVGNVDQKSDFNSKGSSNETEKQTDVPKVATELSKVASDPKQGIAIIVVIALAILYILYGMFTGEGDNTNETDKEPKVERPKIISRPTKENELDTAPVVASLPDAPSIGDPIQPPKNIPTAAPPPSDSINVPVVPSLDKDNSKPLKVSDDVPSIPNKVSDESAVRAPAVVTRTPPVIPTSSDSKQENGETRFPSAKTISPIVRSPVGPPSSSPTGTLPAIPTTKVDPAKKQEMDKRRKSSIMLVAGEPAKSPEEVQQIADFTKRKDLHYTLSKGKMIDAVIENAVNSDFPGEVRAIIARDVYSESGKIVLIPKGSKIYGVFGSADQNYGRVNLNWTRLDLSTGYTVNFAGAAADNLGRLGTQGKLDTKIKEKMSNVVLSTAVNVFFAGLLDQFVKPEQTGQQAQSGQADSAGLSAAISTAFSDNSVSDVVKITNMCNSARNAISNTQSLVYAQVQSICTQIQSSTDPANQKVLTLFNQLNSLASSAAVAAATQSTPTKQQEATKKGMEDFTQTMEEIVNRSPPQPTVSIPQGTKIKIVVNKDFRFPRSAVSGSRVLK